MIMPMSVLLMERYDQSEIGEFINIGHNITIRELAQLIMHVAEFDIELLLDPSYPDRTPWKLLDVTRLQRLNWRANTTLTDMVFRRLTRFSFAVTQHSQVGSRL